MSKNPKPTVEELRFVYELLLKGYDEADILAEYARLYDEGQLKFPYRTDKRFVRDRKKELDAAEAVLMERIKKKIDPLITRKREQHFDDLVATAQSLLANGLDTVDDYRINPQRQVSGLVYTIVDGDSMLDITHDELSSRLDDNLSAAAEEHGAYNVELLIYHLLADHPEITEVGFYGAIKRNPYEIIETLRLASRRRTFKGYCDICKEWQ